MSRFTSTLHVLCEEAKWVEVKNIILHVVSPVENFCEDYLGWDQERLSVALLKQEGPHQWTPLMLSCVRAPLDIIAMLCHAEPLACLICDKSGSLPLHFCASWRRGTFVDVLFKVLVEAQPSSLEVANAWGQTPLHSMLDSKETPPIGGLRIMLSQDNHSLAALAHLDKKKRLPLHTACYKNLPSDYLEALVEAYREACFVVDGQNNLPCHILHHFATVDVGSMEAVLIPLALGTVRRKSSITAAKPNTMSQLVSLTKQVQAQHFKEITTSAKETTGSSIAANRSPAQVACQTFGNRGILPIHIAAHHGVKLEILKGICRQHPEGVGLRVPWDCGETGTTQNSIGESETTGNAPSTELSEPLTDAADQLVGTMNETFQAAPSEDSAIVSREEAPILLKETPPTELSDCPSMIPQDSPTAELVEDPSVAQQYPLSTDDPTGSESDPAQGTLLQNLVPENDGDDDKPSDAHAMELSEPLTDAADQLVGIMDETLQAAPSEDSAIVSREEAPILLKETPPTELSDCPSMIPQDPPTAELVEDPSVAQQYPLSTEDATGSESDLAQETLLQNLAPENDDDDGDDDKPSDAHVMELSEPLTVSADQLVGTMNETFQAAPSEDSAIVSREEAPILLKETPPTELSDAPSMIPQDPPTAELVEDPSVAQQYLPSTEDATGSESDLAQETLLQNLAPDDDDEPWEAESLNTSPESEADDLDLSVAEEVEQKTQKTYTQNLCALEIFERGLAAAEAAAASRLQGDVQSGETTQEVLVYFARRSDLLLSFATHVVNPISGYRYIDDPERLRRLERLIRKEARDNGTAPLSDTVTRIWSYLTNYNEEPNRKKYIKSVGRIITNLPPAGLWKLSVIYMGDQDVFVQIACTGRTIAHEAELRAPVARIDHMMKQYWFQFELTSYLSPMDALNYSVTCRLTRSVGVRLLPQVPLRVTEASWRKPENSPSISPPKPWQRLDVLVTEDCTHTIFVSYYVECKYVEESDDNDHHAFGGMLIVRDDNRKLRPNSEEPWGEAVVACCKVSPVSGSLIRLSFAHIPGRSYGLWYYSHGEPGSQLNVSDVRIRQLLHSCDPQGRSPLHLLLSKMAGQTPNPRLNLNVSMLLAAKFGSSDSLGDVPLHYALNCGVSEEVLQAIITASPAALVDSDHEGRTPIHAALLSKEEPPSLGVIRALLTPPGENAIKLKDSTGRLPIHIAAERGAGDAILKLLIDAYPDGCYRTNGNGDLPLHLLLQSGFATTSSVELLIRPIMCNESICRIGGSGGTNLPLHIAAQYQVSFKVLERLLQTYGEGAERARVIRAAQGEKEAIQFALDIFETAQVKAISVPSIVDATDDGLSRAKSAAMSDMRNADFLLRSDLIFVYNPLLTKNDTGKPYRSDRERIRRLETMIQREAIQCGEERKINARAKLSDMAKQGWLFLCTYSNPDDPFDNFAGTVRRILRGLSSSAVDVLAHVENPKSLPMPNQMVKDCATPVCKLLIMSRLRFVGRYVLYDEIHPVHKSEACLVMRARDHGIEDEYKHFMQIYNDKEQQVEDDISDAGSEPPEPVNNDMPTTVTMLMFLAFARRLGVDEKAAKSEILQLMELDTISRPLEAGEHGPAKARGPEVHRVSDDDEESYNSEDDLSIEFQKKPEPEDVDAIEISKEVFSTFCRAYRLDDTGVRTVVIKFMKTAKQFHREIDVRKSLALSGVRWPVVPILDHYNVDRVHESRKKSIHTIPYRDEMAENAISGAPESTDELYAVDIQEKNASVHNFALYRYAVVMPAGDRDLGEICQHEELGILQIREYMHQVGTGLLRLHEQSTIHGDLKMENVVRFGKNLALIDFDGACNFGPTGHGEKMGGGSSKFCTGVLPPEMICRVDLVSDYQKLIQYEDYWRRVSEDAKDLNLLTPDDIQTISSVTMSLLAKADAARTLGKATNGGKTLRDEMNDIYGGLENRNDWKDILSISLITISFEDLPFSLNRCDGVEEFSSVWNRLIFHSKLWKRVRPRITTDEKYAFLIKTHNDLPDEFGMVEKTTGNRLPYSLVEPSTSIDVWGFGILLFALCAGGSLFHLGFDGDLCSTLDFAELYDWNRHKAERAMRDKIEDPLAQDLLMQILVPANERLKSMEAVLQHPFFGPASNLEAQRILEKYEEQQLIIEETVVIKRMTVETRRKVERSMEQHCKIIFDEDKIVVPTCFVVLPYTLRVEKIFGKRRIVMNSEEHVETAIKIGTHFLEINKATAKLSFWLLMNQHAFGGTKGLFKTRLKTWQKDARVISPVKVATGILQEIGGSPEYMAMCIEMITQGDNISHARNYSKDPMSAARTAIDNATFSLISCYASTQMLYLIDEMNAVPVLPLNKLGESDEKMYPISVDTSTKYMAELFIPFMNIAVMKLTASGGLEALANLLGLPPTYGVPSIWNDGVPGLVHNADKPSSIAEFAVLHEVFRKQDDVAKSGDEMRYLEDFFRDFDPLRTFSDLHRVSDGKEDSSAIWTTEIEVSRLQGQLELASAEFALRELKRDWLKKQQIQKDIQLLQEKVNRLKGIKTQAGNPSHQSSASIPQAASQSQVYGQGSRMSSANFHPEQSGQGAIARPERKRPPRNFRPYFGVC